MSRRAPDNRLDPITALHDAIIEAAEQNWAVNGVSEPERVRLRVGVAAIARAATNRLRAEHAAREGAQL